MREIEVEHCDEIHVHDNLVKDARDNIQGEGEIQNLAEFFKVLGDSTRIRILCILLRTEMCVCDLARTLDVTQSAVSHQLRILKQTKLVKNRRDGKTVFYALADGHIKTILAQGMEHIRE